MLSIAAERKLLLNSPLAPELVRSLMAAMRLAIEAKHKPTDSDSAKLGGCDVWCTADLESLVSISSLLPIDESVDEVAGQGKMEADAKAMMGSLDEENEDTSGKQPTGDAEVVGRKSTLDEALDTPLERLDSDESAATSGNEALLTAEVLLSSSSSEGL